MQRRMDADGAMGAQNASTAPWKTAQSAVSHSDHTHHLLGETKIGNEPSTRLTHEIPDTAQLVVAFEAARHSVASIREVHRLLPHD
jgi:hypothetical protein